MTQSLFPEMGQFSIVPSQDRPEPVFWIEQLVIVDELVPGVEPRRKVPFRRGLNIICTEVRTPNENTPIGHNVGKTLLTRLIRYLLGERYYAKESTRAAIGKILNEGYVIGKIHLKGEPWIVARPLGNNANRSFSIQSDTWESILDPDQSREDHEVFVQKLSDATVSSFESITLHQSGHTIRWRDLLSWLTRDQKCAFGSLYEWRDTKTESGTAGLKSDDAMLLMRAAMDLLTTEENQLLERHQKLLSERKELQDRSSQLQADIHAINTHLLPLITQSQIEPGVLFLAQLKTDLKKQHDGLKELQEEYEEDIDFTDEENVFLEAKTKHEEIKNDIDDLDKRIESLEKDIEFSEKAHPVDYYAAVDLHPCELPECPRRPENRKPSEPDPDRTARIDQMKTNLDELKRKQISLNADCDQFEKEASDARFALLSARKKVRKSVLAMSKEIGKYAFQIDQIDVYENNVKEFDECRTNISGKSQKIDESLKEQKKVREDFSHRKNVVSECFDFVIKSIVNPGGTGKIAIDGNGLQAKIDSESADIGEMYQVQEVLGFDMACCVASMLGVGMHPRFFIHDGPRAADTEEVAYHKLFLFAAELEGYRVDDLPAFQYIVTTTTPPPPNLDKEPFVKVRLHSRTNDGHLLGFSF